MRPQTKKESLWYLQPAQDSYEGWERQALPIGNGELGCKIFGGIAKEQIQFNEKSLWTGTTRSKKNREGIENTNGNGNLDFGKTVKEIQCLLEKDHVAEATSAMDRLQGDEIGLGAFQNFGEITLSYPDLEGQTITDYERGLRLFDATAYTCFTASGVRYKREYFVSYPDQVGVLYLTGTNMTVEFQVSGAKDMGYQTENDHVEYRLLGYAGGDAENGLAYEACFSVESDGNALADGDTIKLTEANTITIIFAAGTNYAMSYPNYRQSEDVLKKIGERVRSAQKIGVSVLRERHIKDYTALYDRCRIYLKRGDGEKEWEEGLATDQLLAQYKNGKRSRLLEELLFSYGRYLLISSSREGGLPANLQGVWNALCEPPWQSDYHLNINLQMNYWLAMNTNLTDTAKPLIDYVNKCLVPPGRLTAYHCVGIGKGNDEEATGWMAHTQNNIFGHTGPGSFWKWGWAPTVGAFILENTYEYYRFTKDLTYLETEVYPAMEEAALLWNELLVEDKKSGRLVVSPGFSPEHGPVSMGNTFDQEMVWQLFTNVLEAARCLREAGRKVCLNEKLLEEVLQKLPRLKPLLIGAWGQIKEWEEEDNWVNRGFDNEGVIENHRHFSHMLGLYPGNHITPEQKDWMEAAKISMEDRKDYGSDATPGWSKSLKMGAWARLGSREKCDFYIRKVLEENTYDNLWETHPPFQIDGNLGTTAGMAEMLLQSHYGTIVLLPALPIAWEEGGRAEGLLARGNVTVNCEWNDGKVINASFESPFSQDILVSANGKRYELSLQKNEKRQLKI